MIVNKKKDLIYNIESLVLLPKEYEDELKVYEYNFKNVYIFESSLKEADELIRFVKDNNVKELLLIDYRIEYETICDNLKDKVKIYSIYTKELAALSFEFFSIQLDGVLKLLKDNKIEKLGFLDENLYKLSSSSYDNTYLIYLDISCDNDKKGNKKSGIGILNDFADPKHSFYNELSAVTLIKDKVNVIEKSHDINRFSKEFNLEVNECETIENVIDESELTLYVNFCNNNNLIFLESMDMDTICILGNTMLLKDYYKLDKALRLNSDDDINEIAQKIKYVRNNKETILKEYKTFRSDYRKKSKESLKAFLGHEIVTNQEETEYEKLLTVGIPVYNVEDYLAACIESVIKSINTENTEVIIVNDGSTDNSEEVIKKYQEKYPELIRYISQENHGLGNVRNVIMKNAKGKYIASIDSDDTINSHFFKEAEEYLKEDVDIVLCDWLSIFGEDNKIQTEASDSNYNNFSNYKKLLYSTIMPSNCNKIVKKKLYQDLGLEFVEGHKYEDLGTNPIIMYKVNTIKYINKPYYEYNIRQNSIMRSAAGFNMIDVLRILEDRLNKYIKDEEVDKDEFRAYTYFWRFEDNIINQWYKLEEKERDKMIDYTYENVRDIIDKIYKDNKYVNQMIDRMDDDTKNYIKDRNKALVSGKIKGFIDKHKEDYKVLTAALILYNYDNRE